MQFRKRLGGFLLALGLAVGTAQAQQPLRIVVPFAAGGGTDQYARLLASELTRRGTQTIVENKPGASGIVAADNVARSKPDGTTVLMSSLSILASNTVMYDKLPYDPVKSFTPVTQIAYQPTIIVGRPDLPYKNITEMVAYAKAHPDKINRGSPGASILTNLAQKKPFHLVAVSTRGTDGQLLAYVEYFGVRRLLVRLARKYVGPEVHCSYALDPVSGQELALEFSLALSEADVDATLAYERVPDGSMEEAFNGILPTAMHGIATRERERAIAEATNFAANGCGLGPDDPLTEAQAEAIPHLIMQSLQPYLARQVEENIKRRRGGQAGAPPPPRLDEPLGSARRLDLSCYTSSLRHGRKS